MEDSLQQDAQYPNNKVKGCILPWIHLHGDIRGKYALCCHTDSYEKHIRTGSHEQSPLEVWNGPAMKDARKKFLSGDYPEECAVCYDKEAANSTSHRMIVNREFSTFSDRQIRTLADGGLEAPPVYLDFRFGNTCNFRCRMCGSDASTSWFKERHLGFGTKKDKPSLDFWTDNDKFWDDFKKIIPNLDTVYFAGGEPFVQDGHYKLIELLLAEGKTDITLQYNSNLSYNKFKDYDIKKIWSRFKKVQLWPSVDGFGERAEYGRKGLDFKTFTKNLTHFQKYVTSVSVVSNIYSITSIPQMIKYFKYVNVPFYITNLTWPNILATNVLPKHIKQDILKQYKELLETQKLNKSEITNIKSILNFMVATDNSHLQAEFKTYTNNLDISRSESFVSTFPEYAQWYNSI